MCENYYKQHGCNFISAMPTNLYGPGDNYDLKTSHVLPALIRKFHEGKISNAKFVKIWGTGNPKREFLHVDDMADACVYLMKTYNENRFVNVGCGEDISIRNLALMIKKIVGFEGELKFDISKPDGTPKKLLDISLLKAMGWLPHNSLENGIKNIVNSFSNSLW